MKNVDFLLWQKYFYSTIYRMSLSGRKMSRTINPNFNGTSTGPTGYRINEMFGGNGNGSWINTPLPANTTVHPDSATAVADIVENVYNKATGTSLVAYPTLNYATYTATLNVIDSSKTPLQPIYISGQNASASWAFRTAAMMYAGFPIPKGLQPTDDSDGTIQRDVS